MEIFPAPRARLIATRYEVQPEGKYACLTIFYNDGRIAHQLFESRSDAESEGERMLNPPFVRAIAASVSVNARLQEQEQELEIE